MSKIKNVDFNNVVFEGGFWKARYELNKEISLKSVYKRFEESGRFDALRFNYEEGKKPYPHIYFDSDVAKWIEAVGYLTMSNKDACKEEQEVIDALVKDMKKNQLKNGYLNSHFIQIEPDQIFKRRNDHELYCAGHLIEGAIAYAKGTGKTEFLSVMEKYVDCIEKAFKIERTTDFVTCGHEEIELALIKLYEYTANEKYLNLALFFINERGKNNEVTVTRNFNRKYDQSDIPLRELEMAEGHAVRAVYIYIAMAEAYLKTGDKSLYDACERLFDDVVNKRMYITGGIGSAKSGESFTVPYDLPNLEAYSESCAAIGLALFALSMQKTGLNKKYADVIEQVMYNNMLSSTSMNGKAFFYENPLEIHLASVDKETAIEKHARTNLPIRERLEVFDCSCCPPNINRIFARVGDFFFTEYENSLIINQFSALSLSNEKINLSMATNYPCDGKISVNVSNNAYSNVMVRIPYWCDDFTVSVPYDKKDGYIVIDSSITAFDIDFKMTPYYVEANPNVRADNGRVALCYGPTVYCMERIDNDFALNSLSVSLDEDFIMDNNTDYIFPAIKTNGFIDEAFDGLYRKAKNNKKKVNLLFRPYWTFANRGETDMLVWVRLK